MKLVPFFFSLAPILPALANFLQTHKKIQTSIILSKSSLQPRYFLKEIIP